jgi:DNA-binding FadR family transcriptional regulator
MASEREQTPTEGDQSPFGSASLLLTSIRGGNAYEETVERLLQSIRLGLVQPGERFPSERELAAMLDVSRDTVRDATSSLAEAGFLDIRRGRYGGTFVSPNIAAVPKQGASNQVAPPVASADEIADLVVFREVLETGAARAAATSELSSDMRDALWRAHIETSYASPEDYRRLDSRLHLLIAEIAGSARLVGELASTRMRMNELLDHIPLLAPNIGHSNQQHEEIVSAILRGQADLAQMVMRDHIEGTAALLRGFLG